MGAFTHTLMQLGQTMMGPDHAHDHALACVPDCAPDRPPDHTFDLREAFARDAQRFQRFSLHGPGVFLDFSKNWITPEIWPAMIQAAMQADLPGQLQRLKHGAKVNASEDRPATHMLCRAGLDDQQKRMLAFAEKVRNGNILGATGQRVTDVIHLGIGGSDLGPRLVVNALQTGEGPRIHFVANVDEADLSSALQKCQPEKTLVIITSKSFTTQETMHNAARARAWLWASLGDAASKHVVAMTAEPALAAQWGANPEQIFVFPHSIGGRYSLWSVVGISIALALGEKSYAHLLAGAHAMDMHAETAALWQNIPAVLAVLSLWYRHVYDCRAHAILPYAHRLKLFPAWLQQLEMESNGKTSGCSDAPPRTAPVVFGMVGTAAQHSIGQWLHQGPHPTPVDFIGTRQPSTASDETHTIMMANMLAQSQALMTGRSANEPYRIMPGNRPSNVLLLEKLDAWHLGALLAMYEHKIFFEACLWGINPFDQWGVELGKQLQQTLLGGLNGGKIPDADSSTRGLMDMIWGES